MKSKTHSNTMPIKLKCDVCGDTMKRFDHVYDNNQYGKTYYKCDNCGHKICKVI
ncbi:MAG: hypothetical protein RSA29_11285 [Clostridium sp.]|uniref:hypothetical protein n=1 Tax=Clostridium sp. TaxID=1506 RepID=UPI0030688D7E